MGTTTVAPRAWHAETPDAAIRHLSASRTGLSSDEAARRRLEFGPNDLTPPRTRSAWTVLARQFSSPLIYALLVSAGVAYAFGEVADGSVVLGVVVLNAAIGFGQEYRAGREIQARVAPIMGVVRDAAVVDPEMAAQWAANEAQRETAWRVLVEQLDERTDGLARVVAVEEVEVHVVEADATADDQFAIRQPADRGRGQFEVVVDHDRVRRVDLPRQAHAVAPQRP